MKKKACQNRHARRRAAQRFGVTMGPKTHEQLIRMIQEGRATFVEKQSNRISVWDCEHEEQTIRLVYDRTRKQIVTFLYPDWEQRKETSIKLVQHESPRQVNRFGLTMPTEAIIKRDHILSQLDVPTHVQERYIDAILSKRAKFINRQDKSTSMYEIEDDGIVFWVIFNTVHGYITNVVRLKDRVLKLA